MLMAVLAMAATAATEPLFPALMKPLLDGNLGAGDPNAWWLYPLTIIGIILMRGVFGFLGGYAMHWVSHRITADLRECMFTRLVVLPTRFFDANPSSRIAARVTNDVNGLSTAATNVLTTLVRDSLTIIALLAWMLYLNWQLTLISMFIMPMVLVAMRYFTRRLRRLSRSLLDSYGEMAQALQEAAEGHRVIKVQNAQGYEIARFHSSTERFRGINMRISIAGEVLMPLIQLIAALALAVVVGVAVHQATRDTTSVGAFVSFITAMLMLLAPAKRLAGLNMPLQRGLAAPGDLPGHPELRGRRGPAAARPAAGLEQRRRPVRAGSLRDQRAGRPVRDRREQPHDRHVRHAVRLDLRTPPVGRGGDDRLLHRGLRAGELLLRGGGVTGGELRLQLLDLRVQRHHGNLDADLGALAERAQGSPRG